MRFGCLILGLMGAVQWSGCGKAPTPEPDAPKAAQTVPSNPGDFFEKVTHRSGVQFVRNAGTNFWMPDQIGSGVALFDFNQDGNLDLYLVQNSSSTSPGKGNQLYQGAGDGTFQDVTSESGLDVKGPGMGAFAGDINNDGFPEVVLTEYGATRIFQNVGNGKFKEVSSTSGVENPRWAAPASFIDFDRDGWLDLVVGNYVDYDPSRECADQQGRPEFCAPGAFPPAPSRLWRNVTTTPGAPPVFEDWSVRSGIVKLPGMALGLVCADFTGDHWPDIFCSDDGRPNRLFVNQKDGTFKEEAAIRGLGYDAMGRTAANMGVAFADFSGDGLMDLFVTHLMEEFHSYFRQEQRGYYLDVVAQSGLQQQGWRGTGFGTVAADFNNDGWIDLAFVNGSIRRSDATSQKSVTAGIHPWWAPYAQKHQIFLNKNGRFADVSEGNVSFCGEAAVGRTLALGDLDQDGAVDMVAGNVGSAVEIYRNRAKPAGNWLKVRLVEPAWGGRDAIGAELKIQSGERVWCQTLQPATSYLASNEPALHFGLGTHRQVNHATVTWASGETEQFSINSLNQLIILQKGSGTPGGAK